MSVHYHDNINFYLGLDRYEGWPVEMFSPDCVYTEKLGMFFMVCDADLGLVQPGACPYHPRF